MKMTREERQRREIENLKAKNAKLKAEIDYARWQVTDEYELRTLLVESLKTRLERLDALLVAMASIRNSR